MLVCVQRILSIDILSHHIGEVISIDDCAERMENARHFYFLTIDSNEGIDASERVSTLFSKLLSYSREISLGLLIIAVILIVKLRNGSLEVKLALAFSLFEISKKEKNSHSITSLRDLVSRSKNVFVEAQTAADI